MKYKIEPAIGAVRSNLSHSQRTSSLFSETPTVAGQILRRGQSITFDEKQMLQHGNHLKRLVEAGSIRVTPVGVPESTSIAADLKKEAEIDKLMEGVIPADHGEVPVAHAESPVVQESTPVEEPVAVQDELKVESKGKKGRK